jgi:RimJ/RimL family protein N-acetyltransferase
VGFILPENIAMQKIAARSGFVLDRTSDSQLVVATRTLVG